MIHIEQGDLTIRSGEFSRQWTMVPSGLQTRAMRLGDWALPLIHPAPLPSECYYDGLLRQSLYRAKPVFPELSVATHDAIVAGPGPGYEGVAERLCLSWREARQGIIFKRAFSAAEDGDAITTMAAIASDSAPLVEFGRGDYLNVVDALPINLTGWTVCAVRFYGRTDYTNDLVRHERGRIGEGCAHLALRGNLLFLEPPQGGCGLFVLRESPPMDESRPECAADFLVAPDGVQILGWGIGPHEVLPDRVRWSYAVSVGGYCGNETARWRALRRFLQIRYPIHADRQAVTANPWGDGNCYRNLRESFVLKELEACAEQGLTHYQIDDGWQAGGTLADLTMRNLARPADYWDVNQANFPRSFAPLAEKARMLGVQLSLWFAPDANRLYRNWRKEADFILDMHRRFDISVFKIDAVFLRTKEAEENFVSLMETVIRESAGRVWFNLDVTNGRRLGYFANLRYGSLFVENRYVRAGAAEAANTYIPWRVLRNLWSLTRYVPPERMQFEFPNRHKPLFQTAANTTIAPVMPEYRDDYLAAITLLAAPLCWAEPSGLPDTAKTEIRQVLDLHHRIRKDLARCHTFPVGNEPSGRSWTGFQAMDTTGSRAGYLLIFRETTGNDRHVFQLLDGSPPPQSGWECLSHPTDQSCLDSMSDGVAVTIPRCNDYRLFHYKTAK